MATTGLAPLPDIGMAAYNGVTWSALYTSSISGAVVQDEAKRTTKLMEYTIRINGVVTLESAGIPGVAQNEATIDPTMTNLRQLLTQHAGQLTFAGKGFGLFVINPVGGKFGGKPAPVVLNDVAWGPVPKLLDFKPLGASRAALVEWQCVVRIPEVQAQRILSTGGEGGNGPVLQFNWSYDLTYDDEGYSAYSIKGTLEIPLTRTTAASRAVAQTVDDFRQRWLSVQTDLGNFRPVRRHFGYSRDKRTVEWEFACEELPPMPIPAGCTKATGTMSVKNTGGLKGGGGGGGKITMNFWTVSLRATYTVRRDAPRNVAWLAFTALLWFRMRCSINADLELLKAPAAPAGPPAPVVLPAKGDARLPPVGTPAMTIWKTIFANAKVTPNKPARSALLTDFGFDEGLYLDSKVMTFHASWWLTSTLKTIIRATGVWNQLEGRGARARELWARSVGDIMQSESWLANKLDPKADAIVDFGGGTGSPGPVKKG